MKSEDQRGVRSGAPEFSTFNLVPNSQRVPQILEFNTHLKGTMAMGIATLGDQEP